MRRPNLRIKTISSHTLFFYPFSSGNCEGKNLIVMGKILYHLNEVKNSLAVSVDFETDSMDKNLLNGKIALRILESLKTQKVLNVVVYTSDNGERINLI